ncbi:MAG TPA: antibiotic biosynthesis monooxygenase [Ignavibacteria bacterium]|nr:antibiotic biosynthesis monooxygenase [Ignavibacteria bacterium]
MKEEANNITEIRTQSGLKASPGLETFVAINYITCKDHYKPRFEELFKTRIKAIDSMPGFIFMNVLKPLDGEGDYLIVSYWRSEEAFKDWTKSQNFIDGHRRGFEDIRLAKERNEEPPMKSGFKTYKVISE